MQIYEVKNAEFVNFATKLAYFGEFEGVLSLLIEDGMEHPLIGC